MRTDATFETCCQTLTQVEVCKVVALCPISRFRLPLPMYRNKNGGSQLKSLGDVGMIIAQEAHGE